MELKISNGSLSMVEYGWQEVKIKSNNKEYVLTFETTETPTSRENLFNVKFADKKSKRIANKIGLKITEEFKKDFYKKWNNFSNK